MDLQPRVQVVLGEAERTDGLLRFVLEGEGFDVIGLASDDRELARVLRGARPAVIVLDGGISAAAAVEARRCSPGSALVVVWPDGVSAVLAEERVDPHLVIPDLGEAVRKAARSAEPVEPRIRVPESLQIATTVRERRVAPPVRNDAPRPARTARRGSQVLVAAATWILTLTALGTIAVAVPKALDLFPRERAPRPSLSPSVNEPDERTTVPERTNGTGQSTNCDPRGVRGDRTNRSRGRGNSDSVPAGTCTPDPAKDKGGNAQAGQDKGGKAQHGQNKEGKVKDDGKVKDEKVKDGGRPDNPGSQANGRGSANRVSGDAGAGANGSHGNGKAPESADTAESADTTKVPGQARNGSRSENGNSG